MTALMVQSLPLPPPPYTPSKHPNGCLTHPSSPVISADRSIRKGTCCHWHQADLSSVCRTFSLKARWKLLPDPRPGCSSPFNCPDQHSLPPSGLTAPHLLSQLPFSTASLLTQCAASLLSPVATEAIEDKHLYLAPTKSMHMYLWLPMYPVFFPMTVSAPI